MSSVIRLFGDLSEVSAGREILGVTSASDNSHLEMLLFSRLSFVFNISITNQMLSIWDRFLNEKLDTTKEKESLGFLMDTVPIRLRHTHTHKMCIILLSKHCDVKSLKWATSNGSISVEKRPFLKKCLN